MRDAHVHALPLGHGRPGGRPITNIMTNRSADGALAACGGTSTHSQMEDNRVSP
jgi:hypothetical protein